MVLLTTDSLLKFIAHQRKSVGGAGQRRINGKPCPVLTVPPRWFIGMQDAGDQFKEILPKLKGAYSSADFNLQVIGLENLPVFIHLLIFHRRRIS